MYRVTIYDGPDDTEGTIIHHQKTNDLKIDGRFKSEINLIDSFNFTFHLNNPGYGKIKPLKTLIEVRNTKTGEFKFEGRVLGPSEDMDSEGMISTSYLCEGELGFLHDSVQRHREFRGRPHDLLKELLDYHNDQVEPYKRFTAGTMNFTNSTDNLYIYTSAERTTFEEIKDKLLERVGGELQIRKENGVRYLDLLERIGEDTATEIRIAKNLLNISREVDPTEIVTRLTPLGTRIESENEEATDASEARLTIESVNNGVPYIDRADLIEEFGIQGKSVVWDDVTIESNLLSTGINYLNTQKLVLNQYQLSALDLSLIDLDIHSFKVGNGYPTINPLMSLNETLRVIGKQTNINSPENSALTIGDKFKTLSQYQNEANQSAQRVHELQSIISRQSQTIGTLNTQVKLVNEVVDTIVIQFGEADLPGLNQSIANLNDVVDQLNIAIGAIPEYELATEDKDGLLYRLDKVKLNKITVDQPIDLDQLIEDFFELKTIVEGM